MSKYGLFLVFLALAKVSLAIKTVILLDNFNLDATQTSDLHSFAVETTQLRQTLNIFLVRHELSNNDASACNFVAFNSLHDAFGSAEATACSCCGENPLLLLLQLEQNESFGKADRVFIITAFDPTHGDLAELKEHDLGIYKNCSQTTHSQCIEYILNRLSIYSQINFIVPAALNSYYTGGLKKIVKELTGLEENTFIPVVKSLVSGFSSPSGFMDLVQGMASGSLFSQFGHLFGGVGSILRPHRTRARAHAGANMLSSSHPMLGGGNPTGLNSPANLAGLNGFNLSSLTSQNGYFGHGARRGPYLSN